MKEVIHFEEIKENTLKKIDEYLLMIRGNAEDNIHKFRLNVEEFQFGDLQCMEISRKLGGKLQINRRFHQKLGKNVEIIESSWKDTKKTFWLIRLFWMI